MGIDYSIDGVYKLVGGETLSYMDLFTDKIIDLGVGIVDVEEITLGGQICRWDVTASPDSPIWEVVDEVGVGKIERVMLSSTSILDELGNGVLYQVTLICYDYCYMIDTFEWNVVLHFIELFHVSK